MPRILVMTTHASGPGLPVHSVGASLSEYSHDGEWVQADLDFILGPLTLCVINPRMKTKRSARWELAMLDGNLDGLFSITVKTDGLGIHCFAADPPVTFFVPWDFRKGARGGKDL